LPQTPHTQTPNPQSPIPNPNLKNNIGIFKINNFIIIKRIN